MSFNPSSFFLGVGTVVLTIAVGFGGGVFMTEAFVGNQNREPNKLEQRAADKPDAVRAIATTMAPVSEANAEETPVSPQPARQQQPASQPTLPVQPTVRDSYAKAQETDIRKEQRRLERIKRAEERKLKAAERKQKREVPRAITRVRQEEKQRQREARREERRQSVEQAARAPFSPFDFED